jgi:hypothetical protein
MFSLNPSSGTTRNYLDNNNRAIGATPGAECLGKVKSSIPASSAERGPRLYQTAAVERSRKSSASPRNTTRHSRRLSARLAFAGLSPSSTRFLK